MTKIISHDCPNAFMDKTYGQGKRVMNKTAKENVYRCCSCGKETNSGNDTPKKKGK